jgi:Oxidoreductase family, NAD-binding Rossmann fold
MKKIRIGLLGPSRSRQGLGPYLARFAESSGALVTACVGSSLESSQRGALELEGLLGHEVRAYAELESMIEGEAMRDTPLTALIIASPHASHEAALLCAAEAGLHTLCEKPLIWGGEGLVERTRAILDRFLEAGLCLQVNTQWPYTLPAYYRLFPALAETRPDRFSCRFSPISKGAAQIPDAMPHPLSLLQALSPSEEHELEELRIECKDEAEGVQTFSFVWPGDAGPLACEVHLETHVHPPRPALYGIQGHMADRVIDMPAYELSFRGELAQVQACGGPASAQVGLEDPMGLLVRDFLAFEGNGRTRKPDDSPLQRIRMLLQIQDAHDKLSQI